MNWFSRLLAGSAPTLEDDQRAAIARWQGLPPADLGRSNFQTRFVVVDVESSGLNMAKDKLISIGAVAVVDGTIRAQDAFEVILRQEEVSATENILIHGIGGSAQREGVDPAAALLRFLDYLGKAPLVAYHAQFDQTMITRAMREFLGLRFDHVWIDLAWIMPELFREALDAQVGLDTWLQFFSIENIQRHNAVADAYATAKLLQVALHRARERGAESPRALVEIEKLRRWLRRSG